MKKYFLPVFIILAVAGCRTDSNINDVSGGNYISPLELYYVSSPAEGESWHTGTINSIRWTSSKNPNPIDIYVIKKKAYYETLIAGNVPNTGKYDWYIPPDQPLSNHYQIMITETGKKSAAGYSEVFYIK